MLKDIWCFLSLKHKWILNQRYLHWLLNSKYIFGPTNYNFLSYINRPLSNLDIIFDFGRVRHVTVILFPVLSPNLFVNNYSELILRSSKCLDHLVVSSVDVGSALVNIGSWIVCSLTTSQPSCLLFRLLIYLLYLVVLNQYVLTLVDHIQRSLLTVSFEDIALVQAWQVLLPLTNGCVPALLHIDHCVLSTVMILECLQNSITSTVH